MAKVIPLFSKNFVHCSEVTNIDLSLDDLGGFCSNLLPINTPLKPAIYLQVLKFFEALDVEPVEVNSDGSGFLLACLMAGKRGTAICNSDLWYLIQSGVAEHPDLPRSVLILQQFNQKAVSLSGYLEQFKPFYSPQTFAQLVSFRAFLASLPKATKEFFMYVVCLILHGDGNGYLSSPTPSNYAPQWQEQAKFIIQSRSFPSDRDLLSRVLRKVSQIYSIRQHFPNLCKLRVQRLHQTFDRSVLVFVNLVRNNCAAPVAQWLRCWWFGVSISHSAKFWEGFYNSDFSMQISRVALNLVGSQGYICFLVDSQQRDNFLTMFLPSFSSELELVRRIEFSAPRTAIGKQFSSFQGVSAIICRKIS
ncbi:MAG: hypothetical protein NZO16_01045 [Deltaproteobacteria bacterium]|nr:hypothetical protein [Deltaproteobacteria bacterium]